MSGRIFEMGFGCLCRLCKDERGNVFVMIALALPLLLGAIGLGAEVSYWRVLHREMQDAADSAAIAAATNNGTTYASEAQSVTSRYGYANGVDQVTVMVTSPPTAPGCLANCYVVQILKNVPLSLSQVIGYNGDTTVNGQKAVTISATAVATATTGQTTPYCILALAGSGNPQALTTNGAPFANLYGCNVMSNTNATCNGHDLNATHGDAYKISTNCGTMPRSGQPFVTDPYAYLAPNIPKNTCGGPNPYPQEPVKKKDPPLPASNQLSGTLPFSGNQVVCGDQQLIGNTTINNTTLVIENGQLDTNGFTLTGDNFTVIFSGTAGNYQHVPTGDGTIDITPPTTGVWQGMAIYQDPALTTGVNVSAAGNTPTWNLSGAIYLPHSSVTFSGAVNKSRYGYSCFTMVIDNITVNGTADIFANDNQCNQAGLKMPMGGARGKLVN